MDETIAYVIVAQLEQSCRAGNDECENKFWEKYIYENREEEVGREQNGQVVTSWVKKRSGATMKEYTKYTCITGHNKADVVWTV